VAAVVVVGDALVSGPVVRRRRRRQHGQLRRTGRLARRLTNLVDCVHVAQRRASTGAPSAVAAATDAPARSIGLVSVSSTRAALSRSSQPAGFRFPARLGPPPRSAHRRADTVRGCGPHWCNSGRRSLPAPRRRRHPTATRELSIASNMIAAAATDAAAALLLSHQVQICRAQMQMIAQRSSGLVSVRL
jgi:hypothetical protein